MGTLHKDNCTFISKFIL